MAPGRRSPDLIFSEGVASGVKRCRPALPVEEWQAEDIAAQVEKLIGVSGEWTDWKDWPDRAASLYIELVTIGSYARNFNNEPALQPADLAAFAEQIKIFLNSWFHE